jgi:hypothetical protein
LILHRDGVVLVFLKPARGLTVGANKKPLRFGTGGAKVVRRIRPPAVRG